MLYKNKIFLLYNMKISLITSQWTSLNNNNDVNLENGKVGIGTNNPSCTLDVIGNIKSTADIIGNWKGTPIKPLQGGIGINLNGDNSGRILIGTDDGIFNLTKITAGNNISIDSISGNIIINSTFGVEDIFSELNVEEMNVMTKLETKKLHLSKLNSLPEGENGEIIRYQNPEESKSDVLYNYNGKWISLLPAEPIEKKRKYEIDYQLIGFSGSSVNINMNYSISVLELTHSESNNINITLDVNISYNGMIKKIIAGPTLKQFDNKYFKITSRFIDSASNGITDNGDIDININNCVSLKESGNSIDLLGLTHNNQPYWMIMNGNFDYDINIDSENDIEYSESQETTQNTDNTDNLNLYDNSNISNTSNTSNNSNCKDIFKFINTTQMHDLLYNNNGVWQSLLSPDYNRIIKYDVYYQNISYYGELININLDNSIVILDLNLSLVNDQSINLYLNASSDNDGVMKKIICGPKLKSHLQNKFFKITSRFVDPSSQGISSSGRIEEDTSILLRYSGNTIELMGLMYDNQPYWMIMGGNFDYDDIYL